MAGAEAILSQEEDKGKALGKLREKVTSHQHMLAIASQAKGDSWR